jgi:hypothetical protein
MRGPFTLSINGEVGLQVEGQENGMMVMMPWHPTYLAAHVAAAGLAPVKDVLSYTIPYDAIRRGDLRFRLPRGAGAEAGRVVRGLRTGSLGAEAELMRRLFNEAWQKNWGFVPITESEMAVLVRAMRPFLYRDSGVAIELDGRPVAFALLLPNVYDLTEGLGGRLGPLQLPRFAWRLLRRRFRSARILLLGVASEMRRSVRGALLPIEVIVELMERSRRYDLDAVEVGWILEDNLPVRRLVEAAGAPLTRRHRIYEKSLDALLTSGLDARK